ncbi:MAG: hypothetical protein KKD36_06450 [Bacteroidetes bacterium]|nr:hypothetical protein [Bacteroidota bacterium]
MKKITFLAASIFLLGGSIASATEKIDFSVQVKSKLDFRTDDPIVFLERGIEFYVFPDGQLDFNTRPTTSGTMYYKSKGNNGVNKTYGAPNNSRQGNYGVKVAHDDQGRVRQVGNVFINYDVNDRVKRIGSVYMTYNRYALERVGSLEIIYNRRGQIVDIVGSVKGGRGYAYNQNSNRNNDYGYSYGNNQNTNDDDSYYYRTAGTKTKLEDSRLSGAVVINNR